MQQYLATTVELWEEHLNWKVKIGKVLMEKYLVLSSTEENEINLCKLGCSLIVTQRGIFLMLGCGLIGRKCLVSL